MKILICGASGFIGRAVCERLSSAGHDIVRGVRKVQSSSDIRIDYNLDTRVDDWISRLTGIDAVVNAVGIIVEQGKARFEEVHQQVPIALFTACSQTGVKRVIQISALGAETGTTAYFRTKRAADDTLMRLPIEWQILRPSLVYGPDGASATAFRALASLPIIPVPALPSDTTFQPIHIADLVAAVQHALDPATPAGQQITCVGGTKTALQGMLQTYRASMGLGSAWWLRIPASLISLAAIGGRVIPGSTLTPDTWRMLKGGSAGDSSQLEHLLGRSPKLLENFITPRESAPLRAAAIMAWGIPVLRVGMAAVWILTGLVSAFLYPHHDSMALLARAGITGIPATAALYGAIALDLVMGLAALVRPSRALWGLQALLIVGYTAVIAFTMPDWLIHPFGPLLKNLPILAILAVLAAENPRWNTSS